MAQFSWQNLQTVWSRLKRPKQPMTSPFLSVWRQPALVTSVAVTALLLGIRQLGLLVPLELSAYDLSLRSRSPVAPDPRLLIVTITEADLQNQKQWPLSDAVVQRLLEKLEQYQPAAIGLDVYRDLPQEPGNQELIKYWQKRDRIIPVCKVSDSDSPGVPSPPNVPIDRVGFSDMVVDPDGIVRRGLLFVDPEKNSPCKTSLSFSFQLAQHYLATKGIEPQLTKAQVLQLSNTLFEPLSSSAGGYQNIDARGYQILLNYRSPKLIAQQVTLTDVLTSQVDPQWIKDRIILIGSTAPSLKDTFYTPYSAGQPQNQKMPGVVIHAQLVSQMLSAVLDQRPLFWFWSDWQEALWIWVWSLTGGVLVWRSQGHLGRLMLLEVAAVGGLLGGYWILFLQAAWVPIAAPLLGLGMTSVSVVVFSAYQAQQEQKKSALQAAEQEKTIALLKALLNDQTATPTESWEISTAQPSSEEMDAEEATASWEPGEEQLVDSTLSSNISHRSKFLGGRYQTTKVLGAGGFGLTRLAEDTQRPGNPLCVIKQLRPARRDEKFLKIARRLFQTEAEILERLGNHDQIPHLLAYFEEKKEFYLVQEFIEGHALDDELPTDKRLPEGYVVDLLIGILEVLAFIHDHCVIHRDIKPTNIIRRQQDSQIVLIDFGAVKEIQPQATEEQEGLTIAIGTRGYTPAEQLAGQPRFCSDIYAVGMIGIQALTGIQPHQLLQDGVTGEISWRHLVSIREEFAMILEKMVRYHFVERYESASAVLKDLRRLPPLPSDRLPTIKKSSPVSSISGGSQ